MKKFISLIIFLLVVIFVNAQITITPFVQTDFAHYVIPSPTFLINTQKQHKQTYRPKIGMTFGTSIDYNFNKKWGLTTGFFFQNMGDRVPRQFIYWQNPSILYDEFKFVYSNLFFCIPIQAKRTFQINENNLLFINLGGTVHWNFYNYYHQTTYINNEKINRIFNDYSTTSNFEVQKVNYSAIFTGGIQRKITDSFQLRIFTSGNILGLPTIKSDNYKARHFNIGLGLGLGYSI